MEAAGARFSDSIAYTGAEEYDRENGLTGPALPSSLGLAREAGGPALDLACGTGFLTIPLAARGLAVTGVDLAPQMLDHARRKTGALPIRWIQADGLAIRDAYGDWDRQPLSGDSPRMIYVCRPRP